MGFFETLTTTPLGLYMFPVLAVIGINALGARIDYKVYRAMQRAEAVKKAARAAELRARRRNSRKLAAAKRQRPPALDAPPPPPPPSAAPPPAGADAPVDKSRSS